MTLTMTTRSTRTRSRLVAQELTLGYDRRTVVDEQDLVVPEGQVTALIGPNGCGKSTLLRGLARLLRPRDGQVFLDGHDITRRPTREVARDVALLPQSPLVPEAITVAELVARGRTPHRRTWSGWSRDDETAVSTALRLTDTTGLADRPVESLSGGQRQRVWIAMVLAQQTGLLLLDEPTTYLDLAHQVELLDLLGDLNREHGRTVVMVLHDLGQAARYADHLVAMADGQVVAAGAPGDVLTERLLADVFGLDARVLPDPETGTPLVVPRARRTAAKERA